MSIRLGYRPGVLSSAAGGGGGNANVFVLDNLGDIPAGGAEGDFGFVSGTPLPLRLKTVTLPDSEVRLQWVLARDYGLTITVNAYADGDELEATLAGQGWTTVTSGTSSITTDGTTITLATAASSSGASLTTLASTLTAAQRFRILGEIWGDTPSSGDFGYIAVGDTGSKDFALYNATNASPAGFQPVDNNVNSYYASTRPVFSQLGPSYLPSTFTSAAAVQLCVIDDSSFTAGQVLRNGSYYCPVARVSSNVPSFPNGITLAASSGAAGGAYSLFLRNVLIYTVS